MFFLLSKTLYYLFLPLFWIVVILIVAFVTKKETRRKRLLGLGLLLLLFFSNDFILNEVLLQYEAKPVLLKDTRTYDLGIVLTGVTNTARLPRDRVHLEKGGDRITHTIQLYREGKIRKILVTGGSGTLTGSNETEAHEFKRIFLMSGIPADDIILEDKARNTHENALYTKQLLDSLHMKGSFLLITSAFHMRRSKLCFRKVGIEADTFPVDFYSHPRKFTPDSWLLPSEQTLARWTILFHEIMGLATYKMANYI